MDAKNAFNSVHRASFLSEVAKDFPELYSFVAKCYINPAFLTMRIDSKTKHIRSEEGVQQGDPLGPFSFPLALQQILILAAAKHNTVLTPSYLDDTIVLGPREESVQCYHMLKNQYSKIGLHLRADKCEAFSSSDINDSNWQLSVPVKKNGIVVLGSPIGHKSFLQDICLTQVDSAKVFLSKLPRLNDAQTASLLLRYSGIPKISHLLRCIPASVIDTAATEFDCIIINTFEATIGCKLSGQEIRQLSLPISQGGFDITKSSATASVAFFGCLG